MVMDFRNGKLVCNPLAGLARPVDDSQDLHAVLLCKARNMKGFGVTPGSDKADADLFLGHGWLTLPLMLTRRLSTATWSDSTKPASLTRARAAPTGPAPRRSHRRAARSSARRRRLLPTPPS